MLSFTYYVPFYCSCSIYCFSFHFHVNILCSILFLLFCLAPSIYSICFAFTALALSTSALQFPSSIFHLSSHHIPVTLDVFHFSSFFPNFSSFSSLMFFSVFIFFCLPTRCDLLSFNSLFHLPLFVQCILIYLILCLDNQKKRVST